MIKRHTCSSLLDPGLCPLIQGQLYGGLAWGPATRVPSINSMALFPTRLLRLLSNESPSSQQVGVGLEGFCGF